MTILFDFNVQNAMATSIYQQMHPHDTFLGRLHLRLARSATVFNSSYRKHACKTLIVIRVGILLLFAHFVLGLSVHAGEPVRLGVELEECSKCGMLHISKVYAGYPATRLIRQSDGQQFQLEAGIDTLTHINGTPVTRVADVYRELGKVNAWATIRVLDRNRNVADDYRVFLGSQGGATTSIARFSSPSHPLPQVSKVAPRPPELRTPIGFP